MNIILAQVLGIVFTVMGLSLLINKKGVPMMIIEGSNNPGLWWLYGCIALIFGSLLVTINDAGSSGLQLLVTIFGWLALLKGIFILIFPNYSVSFYKKVCKSNVVVVAGLVIFVLGVALLFYSGSV